jgi:hypothetical protein
VFSDRGERRLYWLCVADNDGERCGWRHPFPDERGTRNQPRRTRDNRTT